MSKTKEFSTKFRDAVSSAFKNAINIPIDIDYDRGDRFGYFETTFDDPDREICVEVKGSVQIEEEEEIETNFYGVEFLSPTFYEVKFWISEARVKFSEKMQNEILTQITFR